MGGGVGVKMCEMVKAFREIRTQKIASASDKKKAARGGLILLFSPMVERVGFEPTVPCGTPDFESGTFGHSATSPGLSSAFGDTSPSRRF